MITQQNMDKKKVNNRILNGELRHIKWLWTGVSTCVAVSVFFFFVTAKTIENRCCAIEREMELRYDTIMSDIKEIKITVKEIRSDMAVISNKIK